MLGKVTCLDPGGWLGLDPEIEKGWRDLRVDIVRPEAFNQLANSRLSVSKPLTKNPQDGGRSRLVATRGDASTGFFPPLRSLRLRLGVNFLPSPSGELEKLGKSS